MGAATLAASGSRPKPWESPSLKDQKPQVIHGPGSYKAVWAAMRLRADGVWEPWVWTLNFLGFRAEGLRGFRFKDLGFWGLGCQGLGAKVSGTEE